MSSVSGAAFRLDVSTDAFTSSFVGGEVIIILSFSVKTLSTSCRRSCWATGSKTAGWKRRSATFFCKNSEQALVVHCLFLALGLLISVHGFGIFQGGIF